MSSQVERPHRWGPTLLIAATFALYLFLSRPTAAPAGWTGDYEAAGKEAAASQKHIVIAFHAAGCPPCAAMDRTVLAAPEVREALHGFVPLRVDANSHVELARRYAVLGTPAYVVTKDGKELNRREGYLSIAEFVAFLKENSPGVAIVPSAAAPSSTTAP